MEVLKGSDEARMSEEGREGDHVYRGVRGRFFVWKQDLMRDLQPMRSSDLFSLRKFTCFTAFLSVTFGDVELHIVCITEDRVLYILRGCVSVASLILLSVSCSLYLR